MLNCLTNAVIILMATIYFEAAGEPVQGKRAVASVIYNRSHNRDLSLLDTCLEPWQFSCWNRKRYAREIDFDSPAWQDCLEIASKLVAGTFEPINQATHYFNPDVANPAWGEKLKDKARIGNHIFGTLTER